MRLSTGLIAAAVAATLAMGGCAGTTGGPKTVSADLHEWKVGLDTTSFGVGTYTFRIHNAGTTEHELIGFKTTLAADALPTDASGHVNEDDPQLGSLTDGENIPAGGSQTREITFKTPGTYVFLCNLPAHYKQGMYLAVTVK